jgi:hypothetical protein
MRRAENPDRARVRHLRLGLREPNSDRQRFLDRQEPHRLRPVLYVGEQDGRRAAALLRHAVPAGGDAQRLRCPAFGPQFRAIHPASASAWPKDLREALGPIEKKNLYYRDIPVELVNPPGQTLRLLTEPHPQPHCETHIGLITRSDNSIFNFGLPTTLWS